jgi:hypothetical protein
MTFYLRRQMKMYLQATESNKQKTNKKRNLFFVGIFKVNEEKSSIRIRIRIRTKISRIRNTAIQM